MAQRKTLTQRQIDVLRWIGDGCPADVLRGASQSARITAGALRNRGLVTTTGTGSTWAASITDAGSEYLSSVDGPSPPVPREPNIPASQRLIDDVVAAGGSLRVPRRSGYSRKGQPDYERRVASAERRGAVPIGKRLMITRGRDELRIDLCDLPDGTPTQLFPVPIPERVGRYHPIVTEFRDRHDRHEITRAQLPRVCRLLHGFVVEAERRGFSVNAPTTPTARDQRSAEWSGDSDGHLQVVVEGVPVILRVREDGIRSRSIYPRYDYRSEDREVRARRSMAHEQGAKGTVRISILAPRTAGYRPSSWSDGKSQSLEACLPALLMEVEARAAEERERRRLEQGEVERRQLAWEHALTQARQRHAEHHRAQILATQVAAWQHASAIRAYCDAIEKNHAQDSEAVAWTTWARGRADSIDPIRTALAIPEPPAQLPADDLRPFLDGWSPHSPERGWPYGR
jgi:hypothetical protein